MSMLAIELLGSREANVSTENASIDLVFTVTGSQDDAVVRAFVEEQLPATYTLTSAFFGTILLSVQSYNVKENAPGIWEGNAKYGLREPRKTGDVVLSFEGTGGTAHITTSKETKGKYGRPLLETTIDDLTSELVAGGSLTVATTYFYVVTAVGPDNETLQSNQTNETPSGSNKKVNLTWGAVPRAVNYRVYRSTTSGTYDTPCLLGATDLLSFVDTGDIDLQAGAPPTSLTTIEPPDYKRAIGVDNDSVQGVDITVPVFKFTYQWYPSADEVNETYVVNLMGLAGTTNNATWKGFQEGEVLFLGVTGQKRGVGDWELTYYFIASKNVTGLAVGDITGIVKGGHDYLWVQFAESIDAKTLTKIPKSAYVERVYDPADFSVLGLGA